MIAFLIGSILGLIFTDVMYYDCEIMTKMYLKIKDLF